MQYLYVNTWGINDRVNDVNWLMRGPINDGEDIIKKVARLNHPVFNGKNYTSLLRKNTNNAIAQCERAKNLMAVIELAGEKYGECEKQLKKDFDEFDKSSVSLENQIREVLGLDSIKTVDGQVAENITKVAVGVAVITIGAVCTVATGGAASAFFIPAIASTAAGTIAGGVEAHMSGESVWDGMADGFLSGAFSGTIAGGIGAAAPAIDAMRYGDLARLGLNVGGDAVSSLFDSGVDYISGEVVTFDEVVSDLGRDVVLSVAGESAELGTKKVFDNIKNVPKNAPEFFSNFADNKTVKKVAENKYIEIFAKTGSHIGGKAIINEEYRSSFDPAQDTMKKLSESFMEVGYQYFVKMR